MEINYYLNLINYGDIALFLNGNFAKENRLAKMSVKEYLLAISSNTRILKVFKMLGVENSILEKNTEDLTKFEEKQIILAEQLLKGKELILNYFEKGLNEKERIYLKRVIMKLAHDYKIKVIIFTNDIEYLFNFIDKIIILENSELKKVFTKKDCYNEEIYNYIDKPDIIEFVSKCQSLGKKIDNYTEVSEVLKGLYRL